tara:strand:+ start:789 stop:1520 length:732 start_codon:yes stop_codon:yes gene_type:complete
MDNSFQRIKKKFDTFSGKRYWGDDFDVRFYLISQLKKIQNKSILDIGGGIGVISSELEESNYKINLDLSFDDLKNCNQNYGEFLYSINGSMTFLPFKDNYFDCVICSHILELAKGIDIKNNLVIKNTVNQYPTIDNVFKEINRVLKKDGVIYLTTPNNTYYKSSKLTYQELTSSIKKYFEKYSLYFYNIYPNLSKKHRKFNLANSIPKIKLNFKNHSEIINSLLKNDEGLERESVSFYAEIRK